MILRVHLDGAAWYAIGDEIWETSLAAAISEEAKLIAEYAAHDALDSLERNHRGLRRDREDG
jgi:hypothetical protein